MIMTIIQLAVKRRKARELGRICRLIDDLTFVQGKYESDEEARITMELFEAITTATHNGVYILVHNTLSRIFWHIRTMFNLTSFYSQEDVALMKKLRGAFEFSNVKDAEEVVSAYLAKLEKTLEEHVTPLDGDE